MLLQFYSVSRRYLRAQGVSKATWLVFCFLLISFSAPAIPVWASVLNKQVHFEWTYDKRFSDIAGFNIYQNGKSLISIYDDTILTIDLDVALRTDQANQFTIAAFDAGGEESAHSAPYTIDLRGYNVATLNFIPLLLLKNK